MANSIQLDLFTKAYEESESTKLKESLDNVRKGFFAKLSALTLVVLRQDEQIKKQEEEIKLLKELIQPKKVESFEIISCPRS